MSELTLSALHLTPRPAAVRRRARVQELVDDGVVLVCDDDRPVVVRAWPDDDAARRAAGLATRLMAIDLHDLDGAPRAELTAVWHRVPHTRPVSIGAAMAFVLGGVPAFTDAPARLEGTRS